MRLSRGLESGSSRRLSRSFRLEDILDTLELVPSSLAEIAPYIHLAQQLDGIAPRVAFLCRKHALNNAKILDPLSRGRGVMKYKTALNCKLEQDDAITATLRISENDRMELINYYQNYYSQYVRAKPSVTIDWFQSGSAFQTALLLYQVTAAFTRMECYTLGPEITESGEELAVKQENYAVSNILPLDPASTPRSMTEAIRVATLAVQNVRGLTWPSEFQESEQRNSKSDLLDWLQMIFKFQKDNSRNQREHLILLLANIYTHQSLNPSNNDKLDDGVLNQVMRRLFQNYKKWCKYLDHNYNLIFPRVQEIQQRKILYISLYLLVWGEAANMRFMPECLCYIFHHMAMELNTMLNGNAKCSINTSFLKEVITPIYKLIEKELKWGNTGAPNHLWRNYDDLNEYFWSSECFNLGWPMDCKTNFFKVSKLSSNEVKRKQKNKGDWSGKVGFVEVRSFWHVFRSFGRMWSFFILALQAMVIVAWNGSGSIFSMFSADTISKVSSIFITAAFLNLLQATMEIGLSYKAWKNQKATEIFRYLLKLMVATVWVVILLISYTRMCESTTSVITLRIWLGQPFRSSFMYMTAILAFLLPDVFSAIIFTFPKYRRIIEDCNWRSVRVLLWWSQPSSFVGRGLHETPFILFKYTVFWISVLLCKFLFSYYIEVKPLVTITKHLVSTPTPGKYRWHELFPQEKYNLSVVISLWAPIIMVYFMDTQIWFSIWSALFRVLDGLFSRIGEIRSLAMLRSRFSSLPGAFKANLVDTDEPPGVRPFSLCQLYEKIVPGNRTDFAKFSQIWNEIVHSLREEDLIDNLQMDLLCVPFSSDFQQWPAFMLANKIHEAIHIAKEAPETMNDNDFTELLAADGYIISAVKEGYDLFIHILKSLVAENEILIIEALVEEVEMSISNQMFTKFLHINSLSLLYEKALQLVDLLVRRDEWKRGKRYATFLIQDMLELYIRGLRRDDFLQPGGNVFSRLEAVLGAIETLETGQACCSKTDKTCQTHLLLFQRLKDLDGDLQGVPLNEKIKRLHLLLTSEASAIPSNSEARQRLIFFANSLFMKMPAPPKVQKMLSFSVLISHNEEETMYSQELLSEEIEDGLSVLAYLQKIYPDEWQNFLEHTKCSFQANEWTKRMFQDGPKHTDRDLICKWASFRSQTLARTVRGMMYYQQALQLQAFMDTVSEEEIKQGFKSSIQYSPGKAKSFRGLINVKFNCMITCQNFAQYRRNADPYGMSMIQLMKEYPALRIAYVDDVDEFDDSQKKRIKAFYSVLMKGNPDRDSPQEIYRIKLPGNPFMGRGKADNQNHAIIFTRGEALQAIDMNQDFFLEEALKIRNFLQEFLKHDDGIGPPSIIGMRQKTFTESMSSLAGFLPNRELSFGTVGRPSLMNPFRAHFHYGQSDMFDRIFHITRGGISKASLGVLSNEGIYAGFNTFLRQGSIIHKQYMQVGKGQDVGFNQIAAFQAKNALANGEQTMNRDIYRLGHQLDFFRMLSLYYTTVGYYINNTMVVLCIYIFIYGRLYLALSGLDETLSQFVELQNNGPLQASVVSQSCAVWFAHNSPHKC